MGTLAKMHCFSFCPESKNLYACLFENELKECSGFDAETLDSYVDNVTSLTDEHPVLPDTWEKLKLELKFSEVLTIQSTSITASRLLKKIFQCFSS